MSKKRVPNDLFMSWIHPARYNPKVRRDLNKYLRNVPKKKQLLEWAEQPRSFRGPVLIVWAREDKLMPAAHAKRLAEHFENSQLVWVDDSRTLASPDRSAGDPHGPSQQVPCFASVLTAVLLYRGEATDRPAHNDRASCRG